MGAYPSAEQVARAIVQACRECDEDPIEVAQGAAGKARIYAFVAIKALFPTAGVMDAACWFGAKNPNTLVGQGTSAIRTKWWDEKVLARVKAAVAGGMAKTIPVAAPSTRRPANAAPVMNLNPMTRRAPPARNGVSVTADLAGDPAPGRSALDQGYRAGSGLMKERA